MGGNGRGRRGESVGVRRVAGDARTGQIEATAAVLCSWGRERGERAGSVRGTAEKMSSLFRLGLGLNPRSTSSTVLGYYSFYLSFLLPFSRLYDIRACYSVLDGLMHFISQWNTRTYHHLVNYMWLAQHGRVAGC